MAGSWRISAASCFNKPTPHNSGWKHSSALFSGDFLKMLLKVQRSNENIAGARSI